MAILDEVAVEIRAHLDEMRPRLEGYEDLLRLNIIDAARPFMQRAQEGAAARIQLCEDSMELIDRLIAAGFPLWPDILIPDGVMDSVEGQDFTIEAAIATLARSVSATSVRAEIGPERPSRQNGRPNNGQ